MKIKIMSLGEIVTPHIPNAMTAFAEVIAKKKSAELAEIKPLVGAVLHANMNSLNALKLGLKTEDEFIEIMIAALESKTQVRLSHEEFYQAWNTMNPKYAQFSELLKQASDHHKLSGQKLIFISFTNPIDMKALIKELTENNLPHIVKDGQLTEIDGIPLYTTCDTKIPKDALIETIIKDLNGKSSSPSALANSLSKILSVEEKSNEKNKIQYVRGVNKIDDPILKANLDATNKAVEDKAAQFFVDTIVWQRFGENPQKLNEILADEEPVSKLVVVNSL